LQNEVAPVLVNEEMGSHIWLMTVQAPYIAATAQPGQFVHVRVPGMADHILRRPLGVYATCPETGEVDLMYQVLGYGTNHMTSLEVGRCVELLGPIGRGWEAPAHAKRALLVAGGVGSAPLYPLAERLAQQGVEVTAILGASTIDALVAYERFSHALGVPSVRPQYKGEGEGVGAGAGSSAGAGEGVAVSSQPASQSGPLRVSTDDGSFGFKGFATPLVEEALVEATEQGKPFDYVACCGPEPLMRTVARLAHEAQVFCEVSLERRMACGVGACLSCVVDTVEGKKRACVDGPVFPAEEVVW
jgi:dihydroorotate dehydrogenase electron transfer subunit